MLNGHWLIAIFGKNMTLSQGLVKGAELCLNPYFFGWLEI